MTTNLIAHRIAELLHAEGADSLQAGSDETKTAAVRLYFQSLPQRQRTTEMVEAISERLDDKYLSFVGHPRLLGELVEGDLYLHVEALLREPVADALAVLERDLNLSAAVDAAIDEMKNNRSAA